MPLLGEIINVIIRRGKLDKRWSQKIVLEITNKDPDILNSIKDLVLKRVQWQ